MLQECLRGAAVPNSPGIPAWGDGESCPGGGRCSRRAFRGQQPLRPGQSSLGNRESYPGGGRCSRRACGGQQFPAAQAYQLGGAGGSCPGGGRCLRRACGGQQLPRPGHTSMGGRGVLPRRWLVLNEGLRGVAVPNGPRTPSWGDAESYPGGGRCSSRGLRGAAAPEARAHQHGGTGSPA